MSYVDHSSTIYPRNYLIGIFTHLTLCLSDAIKNVIENYSE